MRADGRGPRDNWDGPERAGSRGSGGPPKPEGMGPKNIINGTISILESFSKNNVQSLAKIYNIGNNNPINLMKFINDKDLKSCILELEKTKFTEDIFLEINKIAWRFRTYLKIKTLKRQKINDSEIIKSINVSQYQYKYLNAESSSKTFDELLNSLRIIKETDRLLKSTNINHDIISFYLLKNLCK